MNEGLAPDTLTRFLAAVAGVARGLSLPDTLRHIIDSATALAGARYGALGVIGEDRTLTEFLTTGLDENTIRAIGELPEGHGVLGLLIQEPEPLRLRDLTAHPVAFGFPPHHPPMRAFLGVPIRIGEEVFGNLYLCEKVDSEEFTAEDEVLVESLAAIAAVAIENSRLHDRLQDLAVLRDRERIARDLHDRVIQRLFAAGMALQATSARPVDEATARIEQTIDELDSIVNEIRATIFDLERRPTDRPTLAASVLALVDEMTRNADLDATVRFEPGVEHRIAPEIADATLTALREALANTARHADARTVEVSLRCDGNMLEVCVTDDGRGIDPNTTPRAGHGRGLRNLVARARDWGGTCEIGPAPDCGTLVVWRVPCEVGTFSPPGGRPVRTR